MPLVFSSLPTANSKGSMVSITYSSTQGVAFFEFKAQIGTDHTGPIYKSGDRNLISLKPEELAGVMMAISNHNVFKTDPHSYQDNVSQFAVQYIGQPKDPNTQPHFKLILKRNDVYFKVNLDENKALILLKYVDFILNRWFNAIYAADKKAAQQQNEFSTSETDGSDF